MKQRKLNKEATIVKEQVSCCDPAVTVTEQEISTKESSNENAACCDPNDTRENNSKNYGCC